MGTSLLTPVVNPAFPPNTPANIIQAYALNADCVCASDDASCSNCLTVLPDYLLQSRDDPAVAAIVIIPVVAAIVVFLRTYSRKFVVRQLGKDDFLALLGLALYIPFQVLSILLIRLGSGRHLQYIQFVVAQDDQSLNRTEIFDFVAHILYTVALFVCRLSGIAFYLRLLDRSQNWTISLCRISAGLMALGFIPQIVLLIVHCLPVTGLWPYGWQKEANDYTCLAWGLVYSINSGVSLVCDILLFGIAVMMLLSWNLKKRDKLLLTPVLLPGGLVIGLSVVRLYLVVEGQWQTDQSWWYDPMLVIENAEIGGTLIALCAPGLKPLFIKHRHDFQSYTQDSTSRGRTTSYGWRTQGSPQSLKDAHRNSNQEPRQWRNYSDEIEDAEQLNIEHHTESSQQQLRDDAILQDSLASSKDCKRIILSDIDTEHSEV